MQLPCVRTRLSATDEDVVDGDVDELDDVADDTWRAVNIGVLAERC